MTIKRMKPHDFLDSDMEDPWEKRKESRTVGYHNAFHGPYFYIYYKFDGVSIFDEILNGNLFRQAIFSHLEQGEHQGMDVGMDISYAPEWRRRGDNGRFLPSIHIFGDGYL